MKKRRSISGSGPTTSLTIQRTNGATISVTSTPSQWEIKNLRFLLSLAGLSHFAPLCLSSLSNCLPSPRRFPYAGKRFSSTRSKTSSANSDTLYPFGSVTTAPTATPPTPESAARATTCSRSQAVSPSGGTLPSPSASISTPGATFMSSTRVPFLCRSETGSISKWLSRTKASR